MKLQNFWSYLRFVLRRERVIMPIWLLSIVAFTVFLAPAMNEIYGSHAELQAYLQTMQNPAMIAMMGPVYGADNYTFGVMYVNNMLVWMAMLVAIMNIFFVNRYTRLDEEKDRFEMLRALPMGRMTNIAVIFFLSFLFNLFIAAGIGFGLAGVGVADMGLQGSLVLGVTLGTVGLVYATITGILAQVASTSRGVLGAAMIVMLADFMIRAVGDLSSENLSRMVPLGLALRTQAFVGNYWWPILIMLVMTLVFAILALFLLARRDLGAGLVKQRAGRTTASKYLISYQAFAAKLMRTTYVVWGLSVFVLAASFGSIFGDLEHFIASNPMLKEALMRQGLTGSLTEQFMPFLMTIILIIATIPVIQGVNRLQSEEKNGYLEQMMALPLSRSKLMSAFLLNAWLYSFVILLLNALGFYVASSQVMADPIALSTFLQASLIYLPVLWIFMGLSIFLIGCFPRALLVSWLYLFYAFFASYFGQIIGLSDWLSDLSPFGHVSALPLESIDWSSSFGMLGISLILIILGFIGYQRRDGLSA